MPAGRRGHFPTRLCPQQPRWPLPAGCGFPRGRQYVETPPHSSGCPLPFRPARPWHPGGTGLPGLARGSAFLYDDSPALPVTRVGGRAGEGWLSTALHWQTPQGAQQGEPWLLTTVDCPAHSPPAAPESPPSSQATSPGAGDGSAP